MGADEIAETFKMDFLDLLQVRNDFTDYTAFGLIGINTNFGLIGEGLAMPRLLQTWC